LIKNLKHTLDFTSNKAKLPSETRDSIMLGIKYPQLSFCSFVSVRGGGGGGAIKRDVQLVVVVGAGCTPCMPCNSATTFHLVRARVVQCAGDGDDDDDCTHEREARFEEK
jgi:hypothetical protein